MYAIKQFYLKLFNAKTTMKDKTMMCDETKNECCNHADPPWEGPQVIPAQIRRVDNLIFRKINQFARANGVEQATPMHGWIIGYLADQHNPVAYVKSLDFAPEYVSCEYHTAYSNPGFIAKLQAMGVKVALWTVDTEKAVRSLLPLGPDCLVTNRPDRVREWVEENQ